VNFGIRRPEKEEWGNSLSRKAYTQGCVKWLDFWSQINEMGAGKSRIDPDP
jgi:hypothetical protein